MIDKLDLRVPATALFRRAVSDYIRCVDYEAFSQRVRPGLHYVAKADLRPIGIDAILHVNYKYAPVKNHKLEILDVGKKAYSELDALIASVVDVNPKRLETMRIDLTADITDVSVSWFRPRVRFKHKRFATERGELEYAEFGRRNPETLTAGKRPNVFRIYDKVEESKLQFDRLRRKSSPDAEPLEFEQEFGFKEDSVVTRVERQCGGQRIPALVGTFARLPKAPDFNPFEVLEIFDSGKADVPDIEDCEAPSEYFIGVGLQHISGEMGMQRFRSWLNKATQGNAARYMRRYAPFFPNDSKMRVTSADIYEKYRASVIQQLAG